MASPLSLKEGGSCKRLACLSTRPRAELDEARGLGHRNTCKVYSLTTTSHAPSPGSSPRPGPDTSSCLYAGCCPSSDWTMLKPLCPQGPAWLAVQLPCGHNSAWTALHRTEICAGLPPTRDHELPGGRTFPEQCHAGTVQQHSPLWWNVLVLCDTT